MGIALPAHPSTNHNRCGSRIVHARIALGIKRSSLGFIDNIQETLACFRSSLSLACFRSSLSSDSLGGRSNHLLLKRFRQSALSWQLPHSDNHGITNTLHRISFDSGGPHMVQLHRIHAVSLESVSSMIIFFWIAAWGIASHRDKHSMQQFQTKSLRHQRCTCCHSPVDCHNFALTGRHSWHNTILFIKHTSSRPLAPRYYGAIVLYGCQSQ